MIQEEAFLTTKSRVGSVAPHMEDSTRVRAGHCDRPLRFGCEARAGLSSHLLNHLLNLREAMTTRSIGRNNLKE